MKNISKIAKKYINKNSTETFAKTALFVCLFIAIIVISQLSYHTGINKGINTTLENQIKLTQLKAKYNTTFIEQYNVHFTPNCTLVYDSSMQKFKNSGATVYISGTPIYYPNMFMLTDLNCSTLIVG